MSLTLAKKIQLTVMEQGGVSSQRQFRVRKGSVGRVVGSRRGRSGSGRRVRQATARAPPPAAAAWTAAAARAVRLQPAQAWGETAPLVDDDIKIFIFWDQTGNEKTWWSDPD